MTKITMTLNERLKALRAIHNKTLVELTTLKRKIPRIHAGYLHDLNNFQRKDFNILKHRYDKDLKNILETNVGNPHYVKGIIFGIKLSKLKSKEFIKKQLSQFEDSTVWDTQKSTNTETLQKSMSIEKS